MGRSFFRGHRPACDSNATFLVSPCNHWRPATSLYIPQLLCIKTYLQHATNATSPSESVSRACLPPRILILGPRREPPYSTVVDQHLEVQQTQPPIEHDSSPGDMASLETTHSQAFGLPSLPPELLFEILSLLSVPDALRLLRTNRRLFDAYCPLIYRNFIRERPENRDFLCSWAALRGFTGIVDFALEDGLDVNFLIRCYEARWITDPTRFQDYAPKYDLTLLHLSLLGSQLQLSRWLLEEKGANPLILGKGPMITGTAITSAIMHRSELSMHLASFWKPEPYTNTSSFYHAIQTGHADLVRYLCSRGAAVDDNQGNNGSPLTTAVESGSHEVARLLLTLGANVDTAVTRQPCRGSRQFRNRRINPIVAAAMTEDEVMMRLLLDYGADVNKVIDRDTMITPLQMAVQNNSPVAAGLLLRLGAHPDHVVNTLAWTPYGLALDKIQYMGHRSPEILDLLVAHGADPNHRQWNQPPAVFLAMHLDISTVDKSIFHRVLDHGVDVNEVIPKEMYSMYLLQDQQLQDIRWTALHKCLCLALYEFSPPIKNDGWKQSMVAVLLDRGADPLAGYREMVDLPKTPLGYFLRAMVDDLRTRGYRGLGLREHQFDAMLSFISHPRGGQSTLDFSIETMAQLLGLVAMISSVRCKWYGPSRQSQIQRFAEATCVGERGIGGQDAWLATLLRSPGYWSLWNVCDRDSDVLKWLKEGAGKHAGDYYAAACSISNSPTIPRQPSHGKRRCEDDGSNRKLVGAKDTFLEASVV